MEVEVVYEVAGSRGVEGMRARMRKVERWEDGVMCRFWVLGA